MNGKILPNTKEEELETISPNKSRKMPKKKFTRRLAIKTGLIGAGLYTFEKSIIEPIRTIAAEPTNSKKLPMGLLPTVQPTREGFTVIDSDYVANAIEQVRRSKSTYQKGWLDVWQGLGELIEGNQKFVNDFEAHSNQPDYKITGIPIREMTEFFSRAGVGQNPIGAILGCVDSRVHYERRLGLKDDDNSPAFFVERTIGNIVNPFGDLSLAATLQYNLEGIKRDVVVMIQMVHQNCGMVDAAAQGKAMKLGGPLEAAGYLVKPAVAPGSPWKGFVGSWPNQTSKDVNVMANGMMQLAHLFASSEYLRQRLKEKRILVILGYVPLDSPQIYLFSLPTNLLKMYETVTI